MHYFRINREGAVSVVVEQDGDYYDLSQVEESIDSFADLSRAGAIGRRSIREIASALCENAPMVEADTVQNNLLMPVVPDEVWGAGVTYSISQESREDEGGLGETYLNAYEAERPEVYFKATPSRTIGPNASVGIRGDSSWDVAEPELSIVLFNGETVGYTIGNDMCSREIERENLLYLPQSKIYKRSCAIGPCIATLEDSDPHDLDMSMWVERDGERIFDESTSTSELVRSCEELVSYFTRHNEIPELTVLLTGTSIVPPNDFTLKEDDVISIEIEDIGTLENPVVGV
jgi:2-dehydro-3-deoxy-D-arabinonate dehydratase